MNEATAQLFDEFATSYRRGGNPDVRAYLERAGDDREALADLIDRFLQAVPAREPTEEEIVLVQARLRSEPPLLVLRLRRKLTRDRVVDALVESLGLDPKKRDKVAGYYHELEVGTLDPKPVSERVWDALGAFLGANARSLAGIQPAPAAAEALYRRDADFALALQELPAPAARAAKRRDDEIDRLFTGSA